MKPRALILAAAALLGALACANASATPGQAVFALHPEHYDPALRVTESYFVAQARPGTSFTNAVRVVNMGTAPGTALLYPVDATTGQTSGAVYLDRSKPRPGVGSWVTLGASSVTLGPGKSSVVPITVHVPATVRPGDHLGGIVAENAAVTQGSGKGALQIRVRHLTIAAVEVQVPGPAAAQVAVTGVRASGQHGYQYVYLHLANPGALTTKPIGTLVVSDTGGNKVASRSFELDTFLPGTAIDYPVLLPGQALAPGKYRADVEVRYAPVAIGYRRVAGSAQTTRGSFAFVVSSKEYTHVFQGAPPPKVLSPTASHGDDSRLLMLLAGLVAVLAAGTAFVFSRLRR